MREAIKDLRKKVGQDLVNHYENVVGTAVGSKMVDGREQAALVCFVSKKECADVMRSQCASQIVPQTIGNVPTRIIEVGDLRPHGGYSARTRPIVPGYSVGHQSCTAGTIGGIFVDRQGRVVILSNNHVLARENRARPEDLVYQPGVLDSPGVNLTFNGWGLAPETPYVGSLKEFVPLEAGGKNRQDSAIAEINSKYLSSRMVTSKYPNGRSIAGFGQVAQDMPVQKFGRTTGHTTGKVMATDGELTIQYDAGPVTFTNLIVTDSMSRGGDSGSLLLDEEMNAVGLLFAGSESVTLFNPIHYVRDHYGLTVWSEPELARLNLWGRDWAKAAMGSSIESAGIVLNINAAANRHAYLETKLDGLQRLRVTVFSGDDMGSSWGPGVAVAYPNGVLKVNVRRSGGFGGCWGGQEVVGVGQSGAGRWYSFELLADGDRLVARVGPQDGPAVEVLAVPLAQLGGPARSLRIGKTDVAGADGDHSEPGPVGRSVFMDLKLE